MRKILTDTDTNKMSCLQQLAEDLATARPTAVNLRWAIERIQKINFGFWSNPRLFRTSAEHSRRSKMYSA